VDVVGGFLQLDQNLRCQVLGRELDQVGLYEDPHLIDLSDVSGGQEPNSCPSIAMKDDKTLILQFPDSGPNWHPTHTEQFGDVVLLQPLPGTKQALKDCFSNEIAGEIFHGLHAAARLTGDGFQRIFYI
jgi:hypothetical protein